MAVLVGKSAPKFSAKAVINGGEIVDKFSLDKFKGKKYVIFFFYPADFTFVCPTEIAAMNAKYDEFQKLNTEILAVSVDSKFSHKRFVETEPLLKGL